LRYKVVVMAIASNHFVRIGIGLIVGAGIASVDNLAFGGEASPILVVGMLLAFAATAGIAWGGRATVPTAAGWSWLPLVHLVKHMFAMPDTIHPNTYASILKLAAFSLVIVAIGLGLGVGLRRLLRPIAREKI
jgi:hypothetical protein